MPYFVYILASRPRGVLYVGITNDPARRIYQHREGLADGFTKRFQVKHLVYVESHDDVRDAIAREKRIKRWKRDWKIELVERTNPDWNDLYENIL